MNADGGFIVIGEISLLTLTHTASSTLCLDSNTQHVCMLYEFITILTRVIQGLAHWTIWILQVCQELVRKFQPGGLKDCFCALGRKVAVGYFYPLLNTFRIHNTYCISV